MIKYTRIQTEDLVDIRDIKGEPIPSLIKKSEKRYFALLNPYLSIVRRTTAT